MKKRLLHVVTKLELGGAQRHVLDLIRNTDPARFEVHLLTGPGGFLGDEARALLKERWVVSAHLERPVCPWRDLAALREMTLFMRRNRFDIVHTHSSKAGILGRWAAHRAGAQAIVHTVHGWSFHEFQRMGVRRCFEAAERGAASLTDRIIVVSSRDRERGLEKKIGIEAQYAHIPYGVDESRWAASAPDASLRLECGIDDDVLVVGTVACFKPQKAPEDFLRLVRLVKARVPGVKFLVAGDGALRPCLSRRRDREGLTPDVHFLGWRPDIARFLAALDVFVLTSRWEGLPISVLEAMGSAKPVVVTDTGGVRDLIDDARTGFLVPVKDMSAMAQKVVRLLTDAVERRRLGEAGRERLRAWPRVAATARAVCDLYEQVLACRGGVHAA